MNNKSNNSATPCITEFDLYGLNRAGADINATISETCHGLRIAKDWFHAPIEMTIDRKEALWNYCHGDWHNKKIAVVRHDGFVNAMPLNPIVIEVKEAN